jgi:hypothetical protein
MCLLLFSYPFFPSPKVSGIMSITGVLKTGIIVRCLIHYQKQNFGEV